MVVYEHVEFKTAGGVTLRGRLYPTQDRGPGVVMAPGFNSTKEMAGLPTTAEAFQAAGITALIYDHRSVGASEGSPRNDIHPFLQIDDMSDALSFLASCRTVNPRHGLGLWGMSLGGSVAMACAAMDPRARFVVAVAPITQITHNMAKLRPVLMKAARDRESRVKGNEPFYLPMLTREGENPAGFNPGFEAATVSRLMQAFDEADPLRASLGADHVNRTTVGTYRNMLLWEPRHMWQYVSQPALFVLPEQDQILSPETQMAHFELLGGPKKVHVQEGAGHMDILDGPTQAVVNQVIVDFVHDVLSGKVQNS